MKSFYQRNLPHLVPPGGVLFITFRLKDSIPKEIIEKLLLDYDEELKKLGPLPRFQNYRPWSPHRKCQPPKYSQTREAYAEAFKRYFAKMDEFLDDAPVGPHFLTDQAVSDIVQAKLKAFDEHFYWLIAYTIMSNHVHVLLDTYFQLKHLPDDTKITTDNYVPYEKFMQLIKGSSSFYCNRLLGRQGSFWQSESFDHLVRDEKEFYNVIRYILNNPVKVGVVKNWFDYPMTYLRPAYAELFLTK